VAPATSETPVRVTRAPEASPPETPAPETPAPDTPTDVSPTARPELDEAVALARGLSRCVIETLAGARDIEQLTRWVTDDVYRHLRKRVMLATRARALRAGPTPSPAFTLGNVHATEPRTGAVEAVVVVRGRARTRAVALRLEHVDARWRATAIHVL